MTTYPAIAGVFLRVISVLNMLTKTTCTFDNGDVFFSRDDCPKSIWVNNIRYSKRDAYDKFDKLEEAGFKFTSVTEPIAPPPAPKSAVVMSSHDDDFPIWKIAAIGAAALSGGILLPLITGGGIGVVASGGAVGIAANELAAIGAMSGGGLAAKAVSNK